MPLLRGAQPGWMPHVCDVCRLVDGDHRLKFCRYCSACDAWICEDDQSDWYRRSLASALRMREP